MISSSDGIDTEHRAFVRLAALVIPRRSRAAGGGAPCSAGCRAPSGRRRDARRCASLGRRIAATCTGGGHRPAAAGSWPAAVAAGYRPSAATRTAVRRQRAGRRARILVGHALLEALEALGDVAHHRAEAIAAEQSSRTIAMIRMMPDELKSAHDDTPNRVLGGLSSRLRPSRFQLKLEARPRRAGRAAPPPEGRRCPAGRAARPRPKWVRNSCVVA